MELDFITKIIKWSLFIGLLCLGVASLLLYYTQGFSIFIGSLLGAVNLQLMRHTLVVFLTKKAKKTPKLIGMLGIKFPLLYYVGYLTLQSKFIDPLYFLLGFSIILLVIFALGLFHSIQSNSERTLT